MNKTLIFVVLCALGVLYMAPTAIAMLPIGIQEPLYTFPRTYYAGIGLIIGLVVGHTFKEPSEPREPKPDKKLRLKPRIPDDNTLEELRARFSGETPPPKTEPPKPEPVAFDLDREYKLAIIKIANMNGGPTPDTGKEEVPPYGDH